MAWIKRLPTWLPVALLLALYTGLAASSIYKKSPTFDEPYFLLGGINILTQSDYRLHFGNGPLAQIIHATPSVLVGGYTQPYDQLPAFKSNDDFPLLRQVLFAPGVDYAHLLFLARLTNIALGIALGLAVYFFARRLYGRSAGLLALALYALSPTLIAHGSLATSDMASALFFTLATGCFWLLLQKASLLRLSGLCLWVSALFLTKFSAGLFIPLGLALIIASILLRSQWRLALPGMRTVLRAKLARLALALGFFALSGLAAWIAIWTVFGLRFDAVHPRHTDTVFQTPAQWEKAQSLLSPGKAKLIYFLRDRRLLPEVYIYGLAHTLNYSVKRPTYFLGTVSSQGQLAYFPVAWALKTPPALILIQFIALGMGVWGWAQLIRTGQRRKLLTRLHSTAPWWLLLLIIGGSCVTSTLNIGIRHILPVLPPGIILAGSAATLFKRKLHAPSLGHEPSPTPTPHSPPLPPLAKLLASLIMLTALDTLLAWPNYINYYTPLVAGTSQGYKYLSDSNTDWGQDLPSLAHYAHTRQLHATADDTPGPDGIPRRLYFSYMGVVPLPAAGIDCTPLYCFPHQQQELNLKTPFLPGYYAYSNTQLARLYFSIRTWDEKTQAIYQHLDQALSRLDALPPGSPEAAQAQAALGQPQDLARRNLHFLRSLRLAIFLSNQEPDAQINGSINIYFLDQSRLQTCLYGPPPDGLP